MLFLWVEHLVSARLTMPVLLIVTNENIQRRISVEMDPTEKNYQITDTGNKTRFRKGMV